MSSNLNARVQELIVELSFKRGSDEITAGRTAKGNNTLTGKLVWSDDLVVNSRRVPVGFDAEEAHGIKTIINIPNDADAFNVINQCNAIQSNRKANALGNKEPFVYAVIKTTGLIIFNQGFGSSENDIDRLSVLDVSAADIEISASCPSKAAKPRIGVRVARVVQVQVAKSESFYDYWLRQQTENQMVIDVTPKSNSGGFVNLDEMVNTSKLDELPADDKVADPTPEQNEEARKRQAKRQMQMLKAQMAKLEKEFNLDPNELNGSVPAK